MTRHPATRAVVLALATCARDGGWTSTRDMALAMEADRTVARRCLRELAAREWLYRRETAPDPTRQQAGAGGEWWRVGPRALDLADRYRRILQLDSAEVAEREQRAELPLALGIELPEPVPSDDADAITPIDQTDAVHHQVTVIVLGMVEALFQMGDWASPARIARVTTIHRQTTGDILDELAQYAWVERSSFEGFALYRIGPGVARLAVRPVPPLARPVGARGLPLTRGTAP